MTTLVKLPAVGDVIDGRFRIVAQSSNNGAFGSIFFAEQVAMGRGVVVKFLHPSLIGDAAVVARFAREARLVASFNHKNIVACYAFGLWADQYPYLIFEELRGQTLRELMRSRILGWKKAFAIAADVCAALHHAHARDVVHRDLKPENIFITKEGTVKLLDFGLAQIDDQRLTQTGCFVGTARYVSPEQACGRVAVPASDIYSLGCILYEMILERPALDADDAMALLHAHVYDMPPVPSSIDESVPPVVDAILMRAMDKKPSRRFRQAADFEAALNSAAAGAGEGAQDLNDAVQSSADNTCVSHIKSSVPTSASVKRMKIVRLLILCASVVAGLSFLVIGSMRSERSASPPPRAGSSAPSALIVERFSSRVFFELHNPSSDEIRQAKAAVDVLCNEIYEYNNPNGNSKKLVQIARDGYTALGWTYGLKHDALARDRYFRDAMSLAHTNNLDAWTAAHGWADMLCRENKRDEAIKVLEEEKVFCMAKRHLDIKVECERSIESIKAGRGPTPGVS